MGWVDSFFEDPLGTVVDTITDHPLETILTVGGAMIGAPYLGEMLGAAGGAGAAGLGAAEAGALGSGMYGALGAGAGELGMGALGSGFAGGLGGLGAAEAGLGGLGSLMGGMSAADMFASAFPAIGETVAGGAGGALGSGLFGTGVADIGGLMGLSDIAGLGSGFGDIFSGALGDSLGGLFSGSNGVGDSVMQGMQMGDPYANETAKFAQQNAMEPGQYWDQAMQTPTIEQPSWLETQLQKTGQNMVKNTIKSMLTPDQPQGQQRVGMAPPPAGMAGAPDTMIGFQAPGGLTQFQMGQAPQSPFENSLAAQQVQRELRNRNAQNAPPALPQGTNDGTLAGYELWRALNSQ